MAPAIAKATGGSLGRMSGMIYPFNLLGIGISWSFLGDNRDDPKWSFLEDDGDNVS